MTAHLYDSGNILILGAGPTGLGAAYRLQELGFDDFKILELEDGPGGLASSCVDDKGFTWDLGGHVQFSHYSYYDDVLDEVLKGEWLWHERESWIWIKERFVPYPLQNNIHKLDPIDRDQALRGLERVAAENALPSQPRNFADWIKWTFGDGIAELFMYPYNLKVWACPLENMSASWIEERVVVPDIARIKHNIQKNRDDKTWGPNSRFRFPKRGGTGAIWKNVAKRICSERLFFNHKVIRVDLEDRNVTLEDGRKLKYDTLITTIPLDSLCKICGPLSPETRRVGMSMLYNSVHVLGVGLRGEKPDSLEKICWMYFPEPRSPYYRVTAFSNYSPFNVPTDGEYWSLMAEVSESAYKPVSVENLKNWTLNAMKMDKLIGQKTEVVSLWHKRLEHGYPTPFLRRDDALKCILGELEAKNVYSRGRFGGWKYEVSNQDHSFMQGVELINRLLKGEPEITFSTPSLANSGVFLKKQLNPNLPYLQ